MGSVSMPKPALARTKPKPPPLITVGVISAQKKMLRALTAWEENIPIAEKPMVKCVFIVLVVFIFRCSLYFPNKLSKPNCSRDARAVMIINRRRPPRRPIRQTAGHSAMHDATAMPAIV